MNSKAKFRARVTRDIRRHGCHITAVFDPEGQDPSFAYSVGIMADTGAPEAIVIGPDPRAAGCLIQLYNWRVHAGEQFQRGTRYPGFLEDHPVYIEPAKPERVAEYTLGCGTYYRDRPYAVVQIIWPTRGGLWPWSAGIAEEFQRLQPLLGRKRPDRR